MSFDDILSNASPEQKESFIKQALQKQEYNRNYQRLLRAAAKFATLEHRIDENLDHVLGYIKRNYAAEYKAWKEPIIKQQFTSVAFADWVLLSANEYKSIKEAFAVSGLNKELTIDQFTGLFAEHYRQNNTGGYDKV